MGGEIGFLFRFPLVRFFFGFDWFFFGWIDLFQCFIRFPSLLIISFFLSTLFIAHI